MDINAMTEYVKEWTFEHILRTTNTPRGDAMVIAALAAYEYRLQLERGYKK